MCKHRIEEYKKCRQINDDSDSHDDALVQCQMHRPMQHVQGYLRSHWMPPLGKYSPRIAPADAMVINFWPKRSSCGVVKLLSEASVQKAQNELST
jgi:hypothetical protein